MRVALMVEGQNGLTWDRWRHILKLADRLNFPSLFRSDHYFTGPIATNQQDSLECFLSFVMAAGANLQPALRTNGHASHLPPTG